MNQNVLSPESTNRVGETWSSARGALDSLRGDATRVVQSVTEKARTESAAVGNKVEEYVRTNPWRALGWAAAAGFVAAMFRR